MVSTISKTSESITENRLKTVTETHLEKWYKANDEATYRKELQKQVFVVVEKAFDSMPRR